MGKKYNMYMKNNRHSKCFRLGKNNDSDSDLEYLTHLLILNLFHMSEQKTLEDDSTNLLPVTFTTRQSDFFTASKASWHCGV